MSVNDISLLVARSQPFYPTVMTSLAESCDMFNRNWRQSFHMLATAYDTCATLRHLRQTYDRLATCQLTTGLRQLTTCHDASWRKSVVRHHQNKGLPQYKW